MIHMQEAFEYLKADLETFFLFSSLFMTLNYYSDYLAPIFVVTFTT